MKTAELQDNLALFFEYLSHRFYKENQLSDFLYALFYSSDEFRMIFNTLLNEKIGFNVFNNEEFIDVSREVNYVNIGRPDFQINYKNNKSLLLEIKKYDTEYHFQEYNKINCSYNCLISINKCSAEVYNENKGWIFILWEELIDGMENASSEIVKASAILIKNGCDLVNIKKVNNKDFTNLLDFTRMIKRSLENLQLEINFRTKSFSEEYSGYYFEYNLNSSGNTIYPWVGLYYGDKMLKDNPAGLMFWLNNYHKMHINLSNLFKDYNFGDRFYTNFDNSQYIVMTLHKPKEWESFVGLESFDKQIDFIKNFIRLNLNILDIKP